MNVRLFCIHYRLPKNDGSSWQTRLSVRQGTEFNCVFVFVLTNFLIETKYKLSEWWSTPKKLKYLCFNFLFKGKRPFFSYYFDIKLKRNGWKTGCYFTTNTQISRLKISGQEPLEQLKISPIYKKRKTEKSSFINNLELLSAVPCGLQTFHVYPQRHIRTLSMD